MILMTIFALCALGLASVAELEGKLNEKRDELANLFTTHKKGDSYDFTVDQLGEVNKRNDELGAIAKDYEQAVALKRMADENEAKISARRPPVGEPAKADGSLSEDERKWAAMRGLAPFAQQKSLGELFVESKAFLEKQGNVGPVSRIDMDTKTLFQTAIAGVGAGWTPQTLRTGKVVLSAQEQPMVVDLIPKTETTQAAVVYMEETTYTNNAAETAEAGTYGEAALALTQKTSPVQKIAVWLPVTDEQLEDVPQVRDYVNNRLMLMLEQRLDTEIVAGNGTAPNLRGLLNVSGIQTQAKGADPQFDAILKAIVKIRVTGKAIASGILLHPNDFQDMRLARTVEGIYIWGSPIEVGPLQMFGLPIVQSTNMTENTGLVADYATYTELSLRRGVEFQITNSHGTFFIEGKQAIRADFRCALVAYRPSAICTVTGL